MIGIIVCTHSNFAKGLCEAVEMIIGKQKNLNALGFYEGESMIDLSEKIKNIVEENSKQSLQTIIFVDMFGATPFNASALALTDYDTSIVTGVNLPLLLDCVIQRELNDDISEYLNCVNKSQEEAIKVVHIKDMLR